ncbi:MAG: PilW family protein [Gammaproteobacteria bacterium]|nr:PilW family protein [Gammaproteobacteria bacterium]
MGLNRQRGFTLIELVLASALSVFLMLIVTMAYQANQQSYQYQMAINAMHNSARYIAQIMSARLSASDVDVAGGATLSLTGLGGTDSGNAATDSVHVQYQMANGTISLCNTAAALTSPSLVTPVSATANFSLATGLSGTNSLFCTSDGAETDPPVDAGQELVEEVEHIRVLYGVNTNDVDALTSVDQWVPWGAGLNTGNVLAIQVGFILRSENAITRDFSDQVYNLLDVALTKNDGRLRQSYSFTVALTSSLPVH